MPRITGTAGNDYLSATQGGVVAFAGDDTLDLIAQNNFQQIHTYAGLGNDTTNMGFAAITNFSHGHHVRGAGGADDFNFTDIQNVDATIVGRIEDFDASRDKILIDGQQLDLENLPANVRIVEYNGELTDPTSYAQQWLLIDTSGGYIFYSLEGARVDMGTPDAEEPHFLTVEPDFAQLQDVAFVDQKNSVPDGYSPLGGIIINDTDVVRDDVLASILGTDGGDLIAAGLNDDTADGGAGDDVIWGGSGHDYINGGVGSDTIEGGTGNDSLYGGDGFDFIRGGNDDDLIDGGTLADNLGGDNGNDTLIGDQGIDQLYGGFGDDYLDGGNDDDLILGQIGHDRMFGGNGDDRLFGAHGFDYIRGGNDDDLIDGGTLADNLGGDNGNDTLIGDQGIDVLYGGFGDDVLDGGADDDRLFGQIGSDTFVFANGHGDDTVKDFNAVNAAEKLDFSALSSINTMSQLNAAAVDTADGVLITTSANSSILLEGVTEAQLDTSDFIFV